MGKLGRYLKNALRAEEIAIVLAKYGLSDWVTRLRIPGLRRILRRAIRVRSEDLSMQPGEHGGREHHQRHTRSVHIRQAIEELGPTFIKLGQILSNRSDLLSDELIQELAKLQDRVPPFPFATVQALIEEELGCPLAKTFASFSEIPLASASIAQVHEAWLHDGSRVAVKVQRPGIEKLIHKDIEVLLFLAGLAQRYIPELRHFDPVGLINEFRRQITLELDFGREAFNVEHFMSHQRSNPDIAIPRVWRHCSTSRVLTLEFIQGARLGDIMEDPRGFDLRVIATRLGNSMLEQVFLTGFFHADPHPGNIFILADNRICFLDFGMMGRLTLRERDRLGRVLGGMVKTDAHQVTEALEEILGKPLPARESFQSAIEELIEVYMVRDLGDINIAEVLDQLIKLMREHHIVIPAKFMLVARSFMIAEGVAYKLCPSFSFMEVFGPFSQRLLADSLHPEKLRQRLVEHGEAYAKAAHDLPLDAASILRLLRKGDLHLGFRLEGTENLRDTIDNVGTRFTFGMLLAATLVSSSLIIRANIPPLVNGMPLIGIIGFVIAGFMTLGFLLDLIVRIIKRSRKGD